MTMPRKVTMQDVRQDPVIRKHVIGLILCGAALVLDVAMSFSPMYWYHRYDVIQLGSIYDQYKSLSQRHINFNINDFRGPYGLIISKSKLLRISTSIGLWQVCSTTEMTDSDPVTNCWMHNEDEFRSVGGLQFVKSTGVTQLFQCLGLLFLSIAVLTSSLKLFFLWENKILIPVGAAHAFWGAVSFIGSAGAFGVGLKNDSTSSMDLTENLHFSFAFAVISGVVALAGAVALLIAARSDKAQA